MPQTAHKKLKMFRIHKPGSGHLAVMNNSSLHKFSWAKMAIERMFVARPGLVYGWISTEPIKRQR